MKSSTLLDCIAFQLTPTRTRCDLVITANGKTEKIASGLLDPFLAHLKAAQEQIRKGGYSIVLEPNSRSDTSWFTKGTVERFVRFVSTPEILERVYTIEFEMLQIEKAISLQSRNHIGLHNVVDLPVKSEESLEGNEEKAIVLYQPANTLAREDGSTVSKKNSKVQLVQVLETRKSVLQKEQGMAFARAVAASFDINHIAALLAFAECFGASRMMDACKKIMHLWKAKHESGQWVEVEAIDAISCPADVPSTNPSGIVFHSSNEFSQFEAASEKNEKPDQHHRSQHNPLFAPCQTNSHANSMPGFQQYPMQGMSYYQNYPGNMFQSPYPAQKTRRRRHLIDNGDTSDDSETQDERDTDKEVSEARSRRNKGRKSSKNQTRKVVIRNINYIASTNQGFGDSDSHSCSTSGSNDDEGNSRDDKTGTFRKKGVSQMSNNPLKSSTGDDGHWKAFQNFLLTDADESSNTVSSMLAMEGKIQGRKRHSAIGDASSALVRHNMDGSEDAGVSGRFDISGDVTCMRKEVADQMLSYGQEGNFRHVSVDDGPIISNGLQGLARGLSHAMVDESFVVLHRTGSLDQVADDSRAAMNMDYQLPSVLQKADNDTVGTSPSNYEPHDLNLMPNRAMEDGLNGYDPAIDYEMQAQVKETIQQNGDSKKVTSGTKQGPKKLKAERIPTNTRREKPSKLSPAEDARARAEKLRAYKADLQKLKKEKEAEQLKRLEALKIERQKRIAARSGVTVTQLPSPPQQPRKQLPKYSPISQRSSKFSDTEPGSSSPLQRSTVKLFPKVSSDSSEISKHKRSNSGSQPNNRLTRSASSLSLRNGDNSCTTPEAKATIARIRRTPEPKNTIHHFSSGNTRTIETVSRRRVPERAETKKMPVVVSTQKNSANKEKSQKPGEKTLSATSVMSNLSRGISHPPMDGVDNSIVEKTVVMLESKKPTKYVFHQPEDETSVHNIPSGIDKNVGDISEIDASVPPPASPIIMKEVDCEPSTREIKGNLYTCLHESEEVSPNLGNVGSAEESYQAPHARVSSLEDTCMIESEYGKALPSTIITADTVVAGVQTTAVLVSDGQMHDSVKIPQPASGKHQGKYSPRGLKRLLMFGKRSSTASESSIEIDKTSGSKVGDNALNGSSSEVFTLKNLLNQEESSSAPTAPKKSSRSFSLLSPFKSKNAERKATT